MGSARSSELFEGKESRAFLRMRSFAAVALLLVLVGAMEIGKGGVYDSPMAQDYYVKRFGFLFGGGRSGMHGIEALQADGLVAEGGKVETKAPAEEMRNSVDTYYKAVLPSKAKPHLRKLATQALQKEKAMVELAPKRLGSRSLRCSTGSWPSLEPQKVPTKHSQCHCLPERAQNK